MDKIIAENRHGQFRVTLNEFRGKEYLHIRKYFQNFEGEWQPTKEGFSIELSINGSLVLFDALFCILSKSEGKEVLHEHFKELYWELFPDERPIEEG